MLSKVSFIFSENGYGWTENYVVNTSTMSPTNVYLTQLGDLVNARLNLLGTGASLDYARISVIGQPRNARLIALQNGAGRYGAAAAHPNLALLCRMYPGAAGSSKSLFMRGIPGSIVGPDGVYTPNSTWNTPLQTWISIISSTGQNKYGWYGTISPQVSNVNSYTVNVSEQVTVIMATPIFGQVQNNTRTLVRFSGINGKSELNGQWPVTVIDGSTCQTVGQFGLQPYRYGGKATWTSKAFQAIAGVSPLRIDTRKAGKEYFLEPGRRGARAG